jgi:hypothetical protein
MACFSSSTRKKNEMKRRCFCFYFSFLLFFGGHPVLPLVGWRKERMEEQRRKKKKKEGQSPLCYNFLVLLNCMECVRTGGILRGILLIEELISSVFPAHSMNDLSLPSSETDEGVAIAMGFSPRSVWLFEERRVDLRTLDMAFSAGVINSTSPSRL